jgi:hypothetical protein
MPATGKPHAVGGEICPFHHRDVSEVCHTCPLWIHLRGKHPQSQAEFDEWACAHAWAPILMIENAQQARQTGAAIESFRNVMLALSTGAQMLEARAPSSPASNSLITQTGGHP